MPTGHYPRKPLSAETKAKIGAARRGTKHKPETIQRFREMRPHLQIAKTHGRYGTKEYISWANAKQRAKMTEGRYAHVGICDRWLGKDGFQNFYTDMGPMPQDGQRWSIDRKDPYGDYEPDNCRWATYLQQARNKRKYLTNLGIHV